MIESCSLQEDLNSFKFRDDTIVGESGTSLSGGQKTRLALARAVYQVNEKAFPFSSSLVHLTYMNFCPFFDQDFDMYFFDDIFAAVDYKVAKELYWKCIMGVLRNKTRIVCTHHLQFLQDADLILVMENGRVKERGEL